MKAKIAIIGGIAALAAALAGCSGTSVPSGQAQENRMQHQDTKSLIADQPIPHFNWSQIRQTLIDSETIAADGTATTSFFFNQGVRDPIFTCPSLGLPVANTAQLSNPDQVVSGSNNQGYGLATIGQMDPFGIYSPSSSTGTYVICVGSAGQKYLQYWEGFVQTISAPAEWDYSNHTVKVTGAPSFAIKTKSGK